MSFLCRLFPGLPWCAPPVDPGPESPQGEKAAQCMEAVNEQRANAGLSALEYDACLANQSQQHAEWMEENRNLTHAGFSGRMERCEKGAGAENIAMGYHTASGVVSGWMSSPGHRANMMKPSYNRAGVGYSNDRGGNYWCMMYSRG